MSASRHYVLDAARGFAVVAMVIAHTQPFLPSGTGRPITYVEDVLNDLAAPLFAFLIGITLALTSERARDSSAARTRYRIETAVKAIVLIGLGIVLGLTYSGVAVVLDYLGVTLLITLPMLFLRPKVLFVLAALLTVVSPPIVSTIRAAALVNPTWVTPGTPSSIVLDWLVLAPSYRVAGLLPLYLLGLGLGRVLFERGRLPVRRLFLASALVFVLAEAWRYLDLAGPGVKGGYYEMIRDTALAVGAFTAIHYLTDLASTGVQRISRRLFAPLAVQGRMALSIYVVHVVLLMGIRNGWLPLPSGDGPAGWLIQVGLVMFCWLFAASWSRWLGAGPLERCLGVVSGRHRWSSLWVARTA